jgi:hypothetical protein
MRLKINVKTHKTLGRGIQNILREEGIGWNEDKIQAQDKK